MKTTFRYARLLLLGLSFILLAGSLPAQEPVPAPQPVPRERRVRLQDIDGKNGFKVLLARETAERLRDLLNDKVDEKEIAKLFSELSEEPKQKLVIAMVSANVGRFKSELTKKMGKAGVTLTITGPRFREEDSFPALGEEGKARIRELLPPDVRGIMALLNTNPKMALISPWYWSVQPRDE
ncbi:MAG: hypothetical protein JNM56_05540 [Planctomycetia bacterium]|nr:hypothetical protein [Planctomycetia bacterium]